MTEAVGSVDDRSRPILRLRFAVQDDELLVIIDTAFTGELPLSEADARRWGVIVLDVEATLELGDRSTSTANQGLVSMEWLGRSMDATIQVTPDQATPRPRQDGNQAGMLGTGLLTAVAMTIDFPRRTVLLKTNIALNRFRGSANRQSACVG